VFGEVPCSAISSVTLPVVNKLVLFTFPFNEAGQRLYRKCGFREVGVFQKQGRLDGCFVDVMAMEKLLVEE